MKIVFLIDDDADDREIFAEVLAESHPSITYQEAINGAAAFEKLRSGTFKPDLIFLDFNMPIMDGRTFLQQIKKDHNLQDIPVVIYTTSSHEIDKEFASHHGAALYLTKQYSMDLQRKDIKMAIETFIR